MFRLIVETIKSRFYALRSFPAQLYQALLLFLFYYDYTWVPLASTASWVSQLQYFGRSPHHDK